MGSHCKYDSMDPWENLRRVRRGRKLVFAASIAVGMVGLASCSSSTASTTTTSSKHKNAVQVPSGDLATPAATVSNFLGYLSKHDSTLAERFLHAKSRKMIMGSAETDYSNIATLTGIKVVSTSTGSKYRPNVGGYTFPKDSSFAVVTVSYSATFSGSSTAKGGAQSEIFTVGEGTKAQKWFILQVASAPA
jgi:hypothetical protein